jgi:phosphate/sulfate permease
MFAKAAAIIGLTSSIVGLSMAHQHGLFELFIPKESSHILLVMLLATVIAGVAAFLLIPYVGSAFLKANLKGRDLLKKESREL